MISNKLVIAMLVVGFAAPAAAEHLWTEGRLETGVGPDTPVAYGDFTKLVEQAAPAVVSIETQTASARGRDFFFPGFGPGPMRTGAGSGFIIHPDGYVLTNNHVVENAKRVKVHLQDDRSFSATVVGRDPATDLAVIKVEAPAPLPVVPFGDSDALDIGEWAVAIGNPMGLSHTVTAGIVSAKGRREVRPDGRLRYADFIQTDASINPGNSGGPLFNLKGQVVGINSAINARAQGIGFAIPINMVKTVLPGLIEDGHVDRSWLGVQIQEVTPELARSFGLKSPHGALVAGVVDNGPADQAGVRAGDVIVRFDGHEIGRHDDLPWIASNAGVGKHVNVDVFRGGEQRSMRIRLGRLPGADGVQANRHAPRQGGASAPGLGVKLGKLSPEVGEETGAKRGAVVLEVDNGSVAARAGLRPGDVVVRLNDAPVKSPKALAKALEAIDKGKLVRLLVQRRGGRAFIAFTR